MYSSSADQHTLFISFLLPIYSEIIISEDCVMISSLWDMYGLLCAYTEMKYIMLPVDRLSACLMSFLARMIYLSTILCGNDLVCLSFPVWHLVYVQTISINGKPISQAS